MGNARNKRKSNAKCPSPVKKAKIETFETIAKAGDEMIEREERKHYYYYKTAKCRRNYPSQIDGVNVADTFPCRAHKDPLSEDSEYFNTGCPAAIMILKHGPKSYSAMIHLKHNHPAVPSSTTPDAVMREIQGILERRGGSSIPTECIQEMVYDAMNYYPDAKVINNKRSEMFNVKNRPQGLTDFTESGKCIFKIKTIKDPVDSWDILLMIPTSSLCLYEQYGSTMYLDACYRRTKNGLSILNAAGKTSTNTIFPIFSAFLTQEKQATIVWTLDTFFRVMKDLQLGLPSTIFIDKGSAPLAALRSLQSMTVKGVDGKVEKVYDFSISLCTFHMHKAIVSTLNKKEHRAHYSTDDIRSLFKETDAVVLAEKISKVFSTESLMNYFKSTWEPFLTMWRANPSNGAAQVEDSTTNSVESLHRMIDGGMMSESPSIGIYINRVIYVSARQVMVHKMRGVTSTIKNIGHVFKMNVSGKLMGLVDKLSFASMKDVVDSYVKASNNGEKEVISITHHKITSCDTTLPSIDVRLTNCAENLNLKDICLIHSDKFPADLKHPKPDEVKTPGRRSAADKYRKP